VHVNCFSDQGIEVCTIYVSLFELPVVSNSDGGNDMDSRELSVRGEGLVIIYTFNL